MRSEFFGGNWKMYKNYKQGTQYFKKIKELNWNKKKETVFFPPIHILVGLNKQFKNEGFLLGSQNFFYEDEGAYTGEISAWMLKEERINYSIIGHSERRKIFKENESLIHKKILKGLNLGLKIVLCVGETLKERESKNHFKIVETQLQKDLKNIQLNDNDNLIIAYEPVWAIGTGKTATAKDAEEMHRFVRNVLGKIGFSQENIRIIYGGSVKPENVKGLMSEPNIDGALVGSASLDGDSFYKIVHYDTF